MFLNITGLTEKGKEIKSSDDKKLGRIHDILKNTIIMETEGEEGEIFFLPSNLIYNIHKKKVYLNLDNLDFKKWFRKEGSSLKAEHPAKLKTYFAIVEEDIERINHKIDTAFEENFGDKHISLAIEANTCPYCRSAINGSKRLSCSECGLSYVLEKKGYTFTERSRITLHDLQWGLRLSLPYTINEMLSPEEWVYYRIVHVNPGYLVQTKNAKHPRIWFDIVTSHRLIRFFPGGGEEYNWEIPINRIVSTYHFYQKEGGRRIHREIEYIAVETRYQTPDGEKKKTYRVKVGNIKDYKGELYLLERYLRILNDRIVDHEPSFGSESLFRRISGGTEFENLTTEKTYYPCPHCTKKIKKMALICPECDNYTFFVDKQLQKIIVEEPPSELFICPYCNSRMKLGGKFCAECGAEIDQTFSVFLPLITRMETGEVEIINPVPVSERKCRDCGFQSPIGAKFCIRCGRATPSKRVCPYCGHEYSIGLKACTKCGRAP